MLSGHGFRIIHNTQHTPLEFGKDVIAVSPTNKVVGYQLKGNPGKTLKPREFGEIRGQLEQLATLAIPINDIGDRVPDECYLVTNGEIDEAVYVQIELLNQSLEQRGHRKNKIKTITRGTLLKWSISLGMSLWPSEISDLGVLLRILNFDGQNIFPAKLFDTLLRHTLSFEKRLKPAETKRRITSAAVMTAVALHSFSQKRNYYACITAWLMFATYAIAVCEKNRVSFEKNGAESVRIARDEIYNLLAQICDELKNRKTLAEGDIFSDFPFYKPRAVLIYALLAIYALWSKGETWKWPEHEAIVTNYIPNRFGDGWLWGEGAIPNLVTLIWYLNQVDSTIRSDALAIGVLSALIENKTSADDHLASPYYTIEDVVRHRYHQFLGCEDPFEGYSFELDSYFAESLLIFLVRANLKQHCKRLWPDFTRIAHERFIPRHTWDFCLFRADESSTNETEIYPATMEWKQLQAIAAECAGKTIPEALKADPILLLLFVNIFPFRASFDALKFLHKHLDGAWFLPESSP